ncbi:MAG: class I SAM-dependent methyltransferase [Opitutaceae bacterium]
MSSPRSRRGAAAVRVRKITAAQVRADFDDLPAVLHYTRAAHSLGLWESERMLIERFFPDRAAPLLEAGCGAGRVTLGLWELGYRRIVAFDFARELLDQAISLAAERHADTGLHAIRFLRADATALAKCHLLNDTLFGGAIFAFNGLMQIPRRENRRTALRELLRVCAPGAPLLFTTHDRDSSPTERAMWSLEALRWIRGDQDPRLHEFGDRYFEDEAGRTFMHLPDRREVLSDLAATGWRHTFDAMRSDIARESRAVQDFSDECRFWVAKKPAAAAPSVAKVAKLRR